MMYDFSPKKSHKPKPPQAAENMSRMGGYVPCHDTKEDFIHDRYPFVSNNIPKFREPEVGMKNGKADRSQTVPVQALVFEKISPPVL